MSNAVKEKELVTNLHDVIYKPYLAEIGFVVVKQKIEIDQFLNNLLNFRT